jgi:phosphorylcholine metabolism protein LicD
MINNSLLIEDLLIIRDVCNNLNLKVFLDGGTLLGAIRNQSFLDNDFDLGLYKKELTPAIQELLLLELAHKGFEFKGYEAKAFIPKLEPNFEPYVIKFWSKNAHYNTDLWLFTERTHDYYHRGWLGYFYFLKDTLDILDEFKFLEYTFLVPHNPERYLEHLYGTDWQIPKYMSSQDKSKDYPNWSKELK